MVEDMFEGILAEDKEMIIFLMGNTIGTHLQLMSTLLTTDIEDFLLWHTEHRLQGKGGFSDTWFSA